MFLVIFELYSAYAATLRSILLSYIQSLKTELACLLHESLFPVLHYLYLDLVRTGTRDHLMSRGFGISEELSQFSLELRISLGRFFFRCYEIIFRNSIF